MDVCLSKFAEMVPEWYERYKNDQNGGYYLGYCSLMNRLPQKAKSLPLDKQDLLEILEWGRDQRTKGGFQTNQPAYVQKQTGEAFSHSSPENAYLAVRRLANWGLTYASKTLMFMAPDTYVALDRKHMRRGLRQLIGRISDGRGKYELNSQVRGYLKFLGVCRNLQDELKTPPPVHSQNYPNFPKDPSGRWLLAEIQQAVFQFTKEGNSIVPCNTTPARC